MSTTNQRKRDKCAEIIRLQNLAIEAFREAEGRFEHTDYITIVDDYLGFLLYFVGSTDEWDDKKLTRYDRYLEVRTKVATVDDLMKIPEDHIPPVVVKEMIIGDENGPLINFITSQHMQAFLEKYPFVVGRGEC